MKLCVGGLRQIAVLERYITKNEHWIFIKFGTVNFNQVYTHADFPIFWKFGRFIQYVSRDCSALIFKCCLTCVQAKRDLFSIYSSGTFSVKLFADKPPMFGQSKAISSSCFPPSFQLSSAKRPVLCDVTPSVTSACHASFWSFASSMKAISCQVLSVPWASILFSVFLFHFNAETNRNIENLSFIFRRTQNSGAKLSYATLR